jgi:hypothetical protein
MARIPSDHPAPAFEMHQMDVLLRIAACLSNKRRLCVTVGHVHSVCICCCRSVGGSATWSLERLDAIAAEVMSQFYQRCASCECPNPHTHTHIYVTVLLIQLIANVYTYIHLHAHYVYIYSHSRIFISKAPWVGWPGTLPRGNGHTTLVV